jgi:hypothetical protein
MMLINPYVFGRNFIFNLPFSSSVTYDEKGNTWSNIVTATISDTAMYTGTSGISGVFNSSDSLLAFGLSDFEIGITVKLVSIPSGGSVLIDSFRSAALGGDGFQLYVYQDGRLSFYQKNDPLNEVKTALSVVSTGVYTVIKAKRISGVIYLYVDDVLVVSGSMNVSFNSEYTSIGYQYADFGNGNYPSRGYFRNAYGLLI